MAPAHPFLFADEHVGRSPPIRSPGRRQGQNLLVTLFLLAMLGTVFLRGYKVAIGVAVLIVPVHLSLNVVVLAVSVLEVLTHPVAVDKRS